ncbi:MAG: hypothetical protein B7X42_08725 [Thiomonas sp. 14-66-4]|nr:MAG: hypothetical protein B7X42_08725 [Thiomonas sp. 14-66-4]
MLRRQCDVFADPRFARLGSISVARLYNLRNCAGYRRPHVVLQDLRRQGRPIGVRRAPLPEGSGGCIRIYSVHQGDLDRVNGLYHINAVDCATQSKTGVRCELETMRGTSQPA